MNREYADDYVDFNKDEDASEVGDGLPLDVIEEKKRVDADINNKHFVVRIGKADMYMRYAKQHHLMVYIYE